MAQWRMRGRRPSALRPLTPCRQVISQSGVGGFAMMMGDVLTLVRQNHPVKVVVSDNRVPGFVVMKMKAAGFLETGISLVNMAT